MSIMDIPKVDLIEMLRWRVWYSGGRPEFGAGGYSCEVAEETAHTDVLYRGAILYPTPDDAIAAHWQKHFQPAPPCVTFTSTQTNMNEFKLVKARTLLMKQAWRWTVTSRANGKVVGCSSEKFSRRIDAAANARSILNGDLVAQLESQLASLDA